MNSLSAKHQISLSEDHTSCCGTGLGVPIQFRFSQISRQTNIYSTFNSVALSYDSSFNETTTLVCVEALEN